MNFYDAAQRLASARPLWETVSLATPDGKQILNILRPLNEPLGPIPDRESFEEAVRTRKAVIGGIGPVGQLSGKRLVSLHVPVSREGELRYVITVGLVPSGISAVLRTAGAPPDWIGAIVDADGKVVARTIAEEAELGRQVLPDRSGRSKAWPRRLLPRSHLRGRRGRDSLPQTRPTRRMVGSLRYSGRRLERTRIASDDRALRQALSQLYRSAAGSRGSSAVILPSAGRRRRPEPRWR